MKAIAIAVVLVGCSAVERHWPETRTAGALVEQSETGLRELSEALEWLAAGSDARSSELLLADEADRARGYQVMAVQLRVGRDLAAALAGQVTEQGVRRW